MNRRTFAFALCTLCLFLVGAGSLTVTHNRGQGSIRRYVLDWTSHTDGTVSGISTPTVNGRILRVVFDPGATAPTDDYDVTLLDDEGLDVLMGRGANRDTANTEQVFPGVSLTDGTNNTVHPVAVYSALTLTIANAGSAKVGQVIVYIGD